MAYLGNIPKPIILQDTLGNYDFDYGTLYIDTVNNRVGIGTSSPTTKLHVYGGASKFEVSSGNMNNILTNNTVTGQIFVGNANSTDQMMIGPSTAHPLIFRTSNADRVTITSAGNVGIGTTSPAGKLHTNIGTSFAWGGAWTDSTVVFGGSTNLSGALGFSYNDTTGAEIGAIAPGVAWKDISFYSENLKFFTLGSAYGRMRITSAGNVGIGTSSPDGLLTVRSSSSTSFDISNPSGYTLQLSHYITTTGGSATRKVLSGLQGLVGSSDASNYQGSLAFLTTPAAGSPTERMRITSSGNIFLGTSSDLGLTTRLSLSFTGAGSMYGIVTKPTTSGSTYTTYFLNSSGTYVGGINTTDSVTNYYSASDYRLKENISPLNNAINRLKLLIPRQFNFKNDPTNRIDGFIAHEVSPVVPEAVSGEKDQLDNNGNPIYQSIDNSKMVPLLTASLQEAIQKIEMLENRIQQLENN